MKVAVKEKVVDTAARLFYEQGYTATGINQIIEEAGVAKASLYQTFRSKEDLLLEYLDKARTEWWTGFEAFKGKLAPGKPCLLALFDYRLKLMEEHRYKGCGFMRIAYELPGLDKEALDRIQQFKQSVKAYVAGQVAVYKPALTRREASDLTEIIYNFYEGSGNQGFFLKDMQPVRDARRIVGQFIP